jgi:cytochrome o ubiquinol oxidase subunit 2
MTARRRILLGLLAAVGAVLLIKILLGDSTVALFEPKGVIAVAQHSVIITSVLIMLALAIPTIIAFVFVLWRYQAHNGAAYAPKPGRPHSEWVLWMLPLLVVIPLWVIVWQSTHQLDPYKAIPSDKPPVTIQVIALPWKWLFIYPEEGIATVNVVKFPEDTPVRFELTADGPISSFWIPQLGSQMYAMGAMTTQLNLMASEPGVYMGRTSEINGIGYAGMTFEAHAVSQDAFEAWINEVKQSPQMLDDDMYKTLALPSTNNPQAVYAATEPGLFNDIVMKDMMPPMDADQPMPAGHHHGM